MKIEQFRRGKRVLLMVALLMTHATLGCDGDPFVRVPVSDADFSSPVDYENYDQEMRELSAGQAE